MYTSLTLLPCTVLRSNIVKSMSMPDGPRNGTDSAVPAERIRNCPDDPVCSVDCGVAARPNRTGTTAGTSVGLIPE